MMEESKGTVTVNIGSDKWIFDEDVREDEYKTKLLHLALTMFAVVFFTPLALTNLWELIFIPLGVVSLGYGHMFGICAIFELLSMVFDKENPKDDAQNYNAVMKYCRNKLFLVCGIISVTFIMLILS